MHHPAGWSMRAREPRDPGIPLRSYFLSVGAALLTLLFAANWLLPSPPPNSLIGSETNLPTIRIHSDLKGPEAVEIDTTRPIQVRPPQMDVAGPQSVGLVDALAPEAHEPRERAQLASLAPAELRASFAQMDAGLKQADSSESKRRRPPSPGRRGQR